MEANISKNSAGNLCTKLSEYLALLGWVIEISLEGTPSDVMRKMITGQKEVARASGSDPAAGAKASDPDVEGELA